MYLFSWKEYLLLSYFDW